MPAERFYLDAHLNDTVTLEGTEFHHLARVMRVRVGEEVELVNGRGSLAQAKVLAIAKHSATLQILSTNHSPIHPLKTVLAIPLMRLSKLELIIEKCTELGSQAFSLYPAQHSEKTELSSHQIERLHHIAISAMKQCGRLDLPFIHILSHFEDLFKGPGPYFFGDTRPCANHLSKQKEGVFITGPEKGFSEKELQLLDQKATGLSLHKNILRAETAPILIQCLLTANEGDSLLR